MSKQVYIYTSTDLTERSEISAQEQMLDDLYGEDYIYIVCEDGSFITNEEGNSVLIQEYF